jgi:hypothetical protein
MLTPWPPRWRGAKDEARGGAASTDPPRVGSAAEIAVSGLRFLLGAVCGLVLGALAALALSLAGPPAVSPRPSSGTAASQTDQPDVAARDRSDDLAPAPPSYPATTADTAAPDGAVAPDLSPDAPMGAPGEARTDQTRPAAEPGAPEPPAARAGPAPEPAADAVEPESPAWRRNAAPFTGAPPLVAVVALGSDAQALEALSAAGAPAAIALPGDSSLAPDRAAGLERLHVGPGLHPDAMGLALGDPEAARRAAQAGALGLAVSPQDAPAEAPDPAAPRAMVDEALGDAQGPAGAARVFQTLIAAADRAATDGRPQIVALTMTEAALRGLLRFHAARPGALGPLTAVVAARVEATDAVQP